MWFVLQNAVIFGKTTLWFMRSFMILGKQKCGFILIENQILNCLIVELTNCRKNDK